MPGYLFFLGQTTDLCLAELQAVLHRFDLPPANLLTPLIAQTEAESLDAQQLQDILGGTVKIARLVKHLELSQQSEVESEIFTILRDKQPKRFVLAEFGRDHLPPLAAEEFKHILLKEGMKISYKDAPRSGANAALLKASKALEIQVIQTENGIDIALTESFQDVDTWTLRDFGKPYRDTKRGLLQPKIARMMLNLALGDSDPAKQVALDPFCGAGTILVEATMLDIPAVLGSDLSPEAVSQTRANLEWWQEHLVEQFSTEVKVSPVERLTPADFNSTPTLIVTEPFLGKLTPRSEDVPGIIRGLEKMYRGMFRAFGRLLPSGGQVAILLPAYRMGKYELTVQKTLDEAQSLGFSQIAGPFRAGRPDAVTQRYVYVFSKK